MPGSASGGQASLSSLVSDDMVEFLDVAEATLTDTNGVIDSASTDVNGTTTFVTDHPSTGALDRIDSGAAVYVWDLTDRLGAQLKRSLHCDNVISGIKLVTPPADDSGISILIGCRVNGTTTWAAGGFTCHTGANRYGLCSRNTNTTATVALTNFEQSVFFCHFPGPVLASGNNWIFQTSSNYDREQTTLVQNESDLTTKVELIVVVGYRVTDSGGPHTYAVKLWYQRPWSWNARPAGVL